MSENRLDNIEKQLILLTKQVEQLTVAINNLSKTCGRMDNHIVLVEEAYDVLRSPLNFLTRQVSYITGTDEVKELPNKESDYAITYDE